MTKISKSSNKARNRRKKTRSRVLAMRKHLRAAEFTSHFPWLSYDSPEAIQETDEFIDAFATFGARTGSRILIIGFYESNNIDKNRLTV
jgi:hypothetical protein